MSGTQEQTAEVGRFVAAVRTELDDLPPATVDELVGDLEADRTPTPLSTADLIG